MRGYVFISEKTSINHNYVSDISSILSKYNGITNLIVNEAQNSSDTIKLYTFNNENSHVNTTYGSKEFAYSGNFIYEENKVFEEFLKHPNKDDYVSKLAGMFTISFLQNNVYEAWNNVTRVEPIYWAETDKRIVVGTRAILVHLLSNNSRIPRYDAINMASFLNNGFYANENTPFEGLNVLEPNMTLKVDKNKVVIKQIDGFMDELYSITPTNEVYDEIAQTFLESFLFLKRLNSELTIGLTGGKDSRMVVAALSHLNIDFKSKTNGFESSPDVVVARMIAKELGVPHEFVEPSARRDTITTDLYLRTVNTIKNTEGMLYSYENVGREVKLFDNNKVILGGQGGEILRGGYARRQNFKDVNQVERYMMNAFMKYKDIMSPNAKGQMISYIKKYIQDASVYIQPSDMLNYFFLTHRVGRWSASSRPFYTTTSHMYSPSFENQLVKKTQSVKTEYGTNDSLLYNVLQRIAPKLLEIPFANDRWNFEVNHPYHHLQLSEWINRKPIESESKLSGFNWRKNILTTSKDQLKNVIFSYDSNIVFDIIDKRKVQQSFEKQQKILRSMIHSCGVFILLQFYNQMNGLKNQLENQEFQLKFQNNLL